MRKKTYYPNHRQMLIINGLMSQDSHVGNNIAKIKNGSQQQTNAPGNGNEMFILCFEENEMPEI